MILYIFIHLVQASTAIGPHKHKHRSPRAANPGEGLATTAGTTCSWNDTARPFGGDPGGTSAPFPFTLIKPANGDILTLKPPCDHDSTGVSCCDNETNASASSAPFPPVEDVTLSSTTTFPLMTSGMSVNVVYAASNATTESTVKAPNENLISSENRGDTALSVSSALEAPSSSAASFSFVPADALLARPSGDTTGLLASSSSNVGQISSLSPPPIAPSPSSSRSSLAVATTSIVSTATSSPASPTTSGGSDDPSSDVGKRGLAYNDASLTQAFEGKGISWAYNWGASPDGSLVAGAEYVPMLWGLQSVDAWPAAVASMIASGSRHALSFNEPDLGTQSNIDPQTAATNHIMYMNPLASQVSIGSPAITNGAGTNPWMGIDWLNEFFRACAGLCKVDFVTFHWYADAGQIDYFQRHVQDVIGNATQNGVDKVWLTEFGATGSDADVANFIAEARAFLDASPVERYAYFMCSDGILVDGNSISSPIGQAYA